MKAIQRLREKAKREKDRERWVKDSCHSITDWDEACRLKAIERLRERSEAVRESGTSESERAAE